MYLPSELRNSVSYQSGRALIWSDREIEKLSALGDAVDVGHRTYRIPQHHARSVADAMVIIGGYQRLAEKLGFSCVFRGQTRDYFDADGALSVVPAIQRVNRLYWQYITNHRGFRDAIAPWVDVLRELGIGTGSGVEVDGAIRFSDGRNLEGRAIVNHPVALLRANPVVAAILQHYGFPFAALGRDDLTAESLFPKEEPLYRRLLKAKAPHLAVYA
jgi:hypothetical protein